MTEVFNTLKGKLSLKILLFSALLIPIISCEKSDAILPNQVEIADHNQGNAMMNHGSAVKPGDQSIAAIAIDAGFSELVGALTYVDTALNAGLVDLFLNGTDQYTVFAPTDAAFSALYGALGITGITDLPAELVLDVLLYHVTEGRRSAKSVVPKVKPRKITTLLGEVFTVDSNGMITAIGNTASITAADISASNGVIHVIDSVILPIQ